MNLIFKKNNSQSFKENLILLILIILLFSIDRFSKLKIIEKFSESTYFVNDFINLNLTWNTGIGFGLLSSSSNFYYGFISMIIGSVILFIFYMALKGKFYEKIMYSIIGGGALGNYYDRLVFKAVPDFIDLHYYNFHWFTFNFADIFITLGIILLLTQSIFIKDA
tara:strand:+ start:147 stop:641 length:495 start_codon:yes stop_codon:yes gene_type:complete